ncbi:uncharacterized protein EI90DRAFT_483690 [Cantharellus anzutake]|uniref:uncharacterized protein n=1 Tax=Cantharellus anzutake TaxID=1750568 RepID=UPI00190590BA|nr:uncharacterized protein EI90DRAFT_483690 [Cantharellus anzutake]KAF8313925.1 hypothetical protein EI90DRAFT_483690 [Cantharellus anzutake]
MKKFRVFPRTSSQPPYFEFVYGSIVLLPRITRETPTILSQRRIMVYLSYDFHGRSMGLGTTTYRLHRLQTTRTFSSWPRCSSFSLSDSIFPLKFFVNSPSSPHAWIFSRFAESVARHRVANFSSWIMNPIVSTCSYLIHRLLPWQKVTRHSEVNAEHDLDGTQIMKT